MPGVRYEGFQSILPPSIVQIAQQNHKNYCCKHEWQSITDETLQYCKQNPTHTYVDSPDIFDHIIDVAFRYLDGVADLQYPGADLDAQGLEWRQKIQEFGTNSHGAVPLAILSEYTKMR